MKKKICAAVFFICLVAPFGLFCEKNDPSSADPNIAAKITKAATITKYVSGGLGTVAGISACKNAAESVWLTIKTPIQPSCALKVPFKVWAAIKNSLVSGGFLGVCYLLHKSGF